MQILLSALSSDERKTARSQTISMDRLGGNFQESKELEMRFFLGSEALPAV